MQQLRRRPSSAASQRRRHRPAEPHESRPDGPGCGPLSTRVKTFLRAPPRPLPSAQAWQPEPPLPPRRPSNPMGNVPFAWTSSPLAPPATNPRFRVAADTRTTSPALRARPRPPSTCALCRAPWVPAQDPALSAACNDFGINPYQDSEATASGHIPHHSPHLPLAPFPHALLAMPAPHAPPSPPRLWHHQGPPHQPVRATANSWLYVPLSPCRHRNAARRGFASLEAIAPRRPAMGGGACPPGRIPSRASARPGSSLPPPPGT